ncbi:hypothetical protein DVR12_05405 [Chitinophaga silvatica]|uniref:Outer membrane protein beta-barrel domain-containing protein n=1 Tax=Chitinophaga silvatica TaxID=2282649 RepID=A0A3E1YDQ2_9BACT|nr:hypothetical protein [Chitinophaga silvatica]RFS24641.1 hypothetical protein DVR12_05405 [Chitinophaga silvatica]
MLKKYTIVLCNALLIPFTISAQSNHFSHAIGAGIYTAKQFLGAAAVYSPRFNFLHLSDRSTLSLESNIAAGMSIGDNYNSNTGGNSTSIFMLNVPVLLSWHFGHNATHDVHKKIGYSAGIGWGFHNSAHGIVEVSEDEEATPAQIHVSGLSLSAGVCWPVGKKTLGLRFNWLNNNNQYNADIKGIGTICLDYGIN